MRSICFQAARRLAARILPALVGGLLASVHADRPGIRLLSTGEAPVIKGQPRSQGAVVNISTTLDVYAEGTAPLSYYWFKDGATLPTATNLTVLTNGPLQFVPFLTNDAGLYHVVVSNAYGQVTSDPAAMTLLPNPHINQQPESQIVVEGAAAAIGLTAEGSLPIYYYWYKDGVYDTNISVTTGTLLFTSVAATNAGAYQIIVSNTFGLATSVIATLTIKPNTPRQLLTLPLEFPEAQVAVVPVQFAAQGDENALGFSFHFDPAVLQFQSAGLTDEASALLPGAQWTVNDAGAAGGKLGLSLTQGSGVRMPAQTFRLADLRFTLVGPDWARAGLAFAHDPVLMTATDTNALALPILDLVTPMLLVGTMPARSDAQSGLFEQTLTVINPGAVKIPGLEVLVTGLTNDTLSKPIVLANASGSTNNVPLIYYGPLLAGSRMDLTLTYYVADRVTQPAPDYELRTVPARNFIPSGGQLFTINTVRYADDRVIIEFQTLAGRTYYIEYVDALGSLAWRTALPSVRGNGSRVQWIDDGPPKTIHRPSSAASRFYRGMLMP